MYDMNDKPKQRESGWTKDTVCIYKIAVKVVESKIASDRGIKKNNEIVTR